MPRRTPLRWCNRTLNFQRLSQASFLRASECITCVLLNRSLYTDSHLPLVLPRRALLSLCADLDQGLSIRSSSPQTRTERFGLAPLMELKSSRSLHECLAITPMYKSYNGKSSTDPRSSCKSLVPQSRTVSIHRGHNSILQCNPSSETRPFICD